MVLSLTSGKNLLYFSTGCSLIFLWWVGNSIPVCDLALELYLSGSSSSEDGHSRSPVSDSEEESSGGCSANGGVASSSEESSILRLTNDGIVSSSSVSSVTVSTTGVCFLVAFRFCALVRGLGGLGGLLGQASMSDSSVSDSDEEESVSALSISAGGSVSVPSGVASVSCFMLSVDCSLRAFVLR